MGFLIDAAAYYQSLVSAIRQAKKTIYIAAWDIDSKTHLLRAGKKEAPTLGLVDFLKHTVERTPGLYVYILSWDFSMIYMLERELLPLFRMGWDVHPRIVFRLDGEHPTGASHHQKVVVVDDSLAFCGGIDVTKNRWDTPEHRVDDPRRRNSHGKPYDPFHDIQAVVDGDPAASLGDLFRDRWLRATGQHLVPPETDSLMPWPEEAGPDLRDARVAVARTLPQYKGRAEVREIESLYIDAIQASRHHLYIENQYLTSPAITEALAQRLNHEDGPEVVIILPKLSSGWLEQSTMDALRAHMLKRLLDADRYNRLRFFCPALPGDRHVYVHAKVMVVDDRLARVGSSNLTNRSLGFDTECDLAVEAWDEPLVAEGIAGFRNRLMAEHLGTSPAKVDRALKESHSVIRTIETLQGKKRTLDPLEPDQKIPLNGITIFSDTSLPDPEKPAKFDQILDLFVHDENSEPRSRPLLKFFIVLALLLGVAAAWRWTPLSEWISIHRLAGWGYVLKESLFSPLGVVAAYVVGGMAMIPVTLLVGVTAMVFPPLHGALYALGGCLASAVVSYGIGRFMGQKPIQKIAGRRINRLSKRLARQGLLTIILVRNLPLAPFTIVNMVAGASRITFKDYFLGTALGMAPGILAITVFADRLLAALRDPDWANIGLALGVAAALAGGLFWIRKRIAERP